MYHVLYVDDDTHLLDVARYFLEESGEIRLDTARLATEALSLPGLGTVDAIVADYEMPKMDGIVFLKKVREAYGDIPFILFTGKGREQIVIEAINNGADFYLQKGGEPNAQFAELAHKVKNAIERRRAITALRESERKYHNLYQHALVGLFETSLEDALIIACNQKYCDLAGFASVEEALGSDVLQLYADPGDREDIRRVLNEEELIRDRIVRFRNLTSGSTFWGQFSARLNREKGRAEGTIIDITERIRAEEKLRESEETFRSFIHESADGIVLIDEEGVVIEWNAALEEISGIPRREAVGSSYLDLVMRVIVPDDHDPDREARMAQAVGTALRTGESPLFSRRLEAVICRPDGIRRRVQQTVFPLRTSRGYRIGSITRDISDSVKPPASSYVP